MSTFVDKTACGRPRLLKKHDYMTIYGKDEIAISF